MIFNKIKVYFLEEYNQVIIIIINLKIIKKIIIQIKITKNIYRI